MMKTNEYNKPIISMMAILLWGFIFYSSVPFYYEMYKNWDEKSASNEQLTPCSGLGTDVCIDKVRLNFENTGKTILGEEYLGNGNFGISFIDRNKPGSYSARVSTDCECGITNVQVSNLR